MKKIIDRKKGEKGAITLFVLLACLFFVFTLAGVYISNLNKQQTQEQQLRQIQENYARNIDRIDEIYESLSKGIKINLSQNPEAETWAREVTLTGTAEVKENYEATIKGYAFTKDGDEEITWESVTDEKKIEKALKVTENGEYIFWVKDSKGEIYKSNKITVENIDRTEPTEGTIIAKEENQNGKEYELSKSLWTDKNIYIEKVDGSDPEPGSGHKQTTITIQKME